MPLYEYSCPEHGSFDEFQKMHTEHRARCPKCGQVARRNFAIGGFTIDFRPGWDSGFGKYIDTKKQRENLLAEKNWSRIKD